MGLDTKTWHGKVLKSCEIGFKRFVLLIFRLCGGIKKARGEFNPANLKKVLFIRHDRLGDMVISLPIFHNLKRINPQIEVDVVCGKDNIEIIRTDPNINKVFFYHKKPLRDYKNIMAMRRENYDCVVDLIFGASVTATILISLIAGRGFKLGAGKLKYAKYFDKTVEMDRFENHIIESTGSVLNLFGIDLKDCDMTPHLFFEENDFKIGREFINGLKTKYDKTLMINLSAGSPARTLPMPKNFKLIELLLKQYPDWAIVLSYAPSEYWKAKKIIAKYGDKVTPIPSGLSIRQVGGMMKFLDYMITPDTSMVHLASAFNLPSLVMYSANDGNFRSWGPYNPNIIAIRSSDYYRIDQIDVQSLFDAFNKMVSELETANLE